MTASAPTDTVRFSARARGASTAETIVKNPTDSAWRLQPSITNKNWRGAEILEVPANGEATYVITFAPLAVSTEEDPHVGTVRFELPDGSVDTRALVGVADEADKAGAVEATVPAKKTETIKIDVKNWLTRRQRFRATVVFGEGAGDANEEPPLDETVTMRGPEFMEIAGNQTRPYPLTFYGFRANETTRATVSFENADTGDVAAYDVSVTTSDPDVLGSIPLRTAARQKVVTQIPVTNPTSSPVDVTVRCSNPRTFATNEKTTIPPRGVAQVGVAYAPIAAETDAVSDVVRERRSDVAVRFEAQRDRRRPRARRELHRAPGPPRPRRCRSGTSWRRPRRSMRGGAAAGTVAPSCSARRRTRRRARRRSTKETKVSNSTST